jgi:hypothetical protein
MNTQQKVIKNKVGLLKLAETLGSVSQACKVMEFSRDSFFWLSCGGDAGGHRRDYWPASNLRSLLYGLVVAYGFRWQRRNLDNHIGKDKLHERYNPRDAPQPLPPPCSPGRLRAQTRRTPAAVAAIHRKLGNPAGVPGLVPSLAAPRKKRTMSAAAPCK